MEKQYHEYKQILQESLEPLGFAAQPENTAGLGRSIAFTKDALQMTLIYDLRDKLVILQGKKDGKLVTKGAYFYDAASIKKNFENKLNEILAAQGFPVEAPAPTPPAPGSGAKPEKSGGFLSKLFGKK